MPPIVKSIEEGSRELLETVASVLAEANVGRHIVIGGWCPVLRNKSGIEHPGTIDVDVLFEDGFQEGALAPLYGLLKAKGFGISAKHGFQLLRETIINEEKVFFNVDLLHPKMATEPVGMFQDHMELDIPVDAEGKRLKNIISIVQPNSKVLFEENLYSTYQLQSANISLVDFTGMYLTKIDSCQKAKRERDSLDILIAVENAGIDFDKIAEIRSKNERIEESCKRFEKYLVEYSAIFDDNVNNYLNLDYSASEKVLAAIRSKI